MTQVPLTSSLLLFRTPSIFLQSLASKKASYFNADYYDQQLPYLNINIFKSFSHYYPSKSDCTGEQKESFFVPWFCTSFTQVYNFNNIRHIGTFYCSILCEMIKNYRHNNYSMFHKVGQKHVSHLLRSKREQNRKLILMDHVTGAERARCVHHYYKKQ